LRLGRKVLPSEQPAHEDRGRDRLNLFPKCMKGSTVNSLEDTAFAPFDVVVVRRFGALEDAAHQ
jgi:hypothetical protein